MGALRRDDLGALFSQRLDLLADALLSAPTRIDYARRRQMLATFELNEHQWAEICSQSGVDASRRWWSLRRPQAAAWIWEIMTGGDWHHAPTLRLAELAPAQQAVTANAYGSYFVAKHLVKVRPALTQFAARLLQRHDLPGPVLMDLPIPVLAL